MSQTVPTAARYRVFQASNGYRWLEWGGIIVAACLIIIAFIGSTVAPYGGEEITSAVLAKPSSSHWFGTDQNGMDIFSRILAGARYDVLIGVAGTLIASALGVACGVTAGYLGGIARSLIRFTDTLQAFPVFIFAMAAIAFAGQSLAVIIIVVGVINSPVYARIAYAQAARLKGLPFIDAARVSGLTPSRILRRHIVPNTMSPVIGQLAISVGFAILLVAGLSFVGVGIRTPTPEWGAMVALGTGGIVSGQWWPAIFPGLALALTIFSFSLVGEHLTRRFGATAA
jgi:peptide/nickel transport system permease protein